MGGRFTRQRAAELAQTALILSEQKMTQRDIAAVLGVTQPTVCMWLRKQREHGMSMQMRTAHMIRAELVCCDSYERFGRARSSMEEMQLFMADPSFHERCFYGEWAAQIAERIQ